MSEAVMHALSTAASGWHRRRLSLAAWLPSLLLVMLAATLSQTAFAQADMPEYLVNIGYRELVAELGGKPHLPEGAPVTQVESPESGDGGSHPWFPDPDDVALHGKTIIDRTASPASPPSGHATSVASLFYGAHSLLADQPTRVYAYPMLYWVGRGYLMADNPAEAPSVVRSRVANHSWIGTVDPVTDANILRRLDWVVDTDDYIQCVGLGNGGGNRPLLASAYNVIAAGCSDGSHGTGSLALDNFYTGGGVRPHVVVPVNTTSSATAVVSSAAALLVHLGHSRPELSVDPPGHNRFDDDVQAAERSETIKAALMAGADRVTHNHGFADILDYGQVASRLADNGLDTTYGAGQLNIRNSWRIIAAGEQNSEEQGGGASGPEGFDYAPNFAGDGNGNRSYYLQAGGDRPVLTASLVWNAEILDFTDSGLGPAGRLGDLDLVLFDLTAGRTVAQSRSHSDTNENLWVYLRSGHQYRLTVEVARGAEPFERDYALAWRVDESTGPLAAAQGPNHRLAFVAGLGLLMVGGSLAHKRHSRARRGTSHDPEPTSS